MAENNKHLFPQTSGGQKSENKVLAGLVSPEAFFLGHLLAVLLRPSLCMHIPGVSFSSYNDSSHIKLGTLHYNLIKLNYVTL